MWNGKVECIHPASDLGISVPGAQVAGQVDLRLVIDPHVGGGRASGTADEKLIARGQRSYEKLECAQCHGENAEGLPDKGATLAGTELTEAEFKDILRTGGKGELGNDHLYGTSAISESGIGALYAFLQSLAQ